MPLPTIELYEGELVEGETIELQAVSPGDTLFFKHPMKKFMAFAEKNIKEQDGEYYYEEGFGDIYESIDEDFVQVKNLVAGRLFVIFSYTDIYNNSFDVVETFVVKPKVTINAFETTTQGDTEELSFTSSLLNVVATWTFADNGDIVVGNDISRQFNIDGYNDYTVELDYSNATYDDGSLVVWETSPEDTISNTVISAGRSGIASSVPAWPVVISVTDETENEYLVKRNLDELMTLELQVSTANFDGDSNAPLMVVVKDISTYSIDFDEEPDGLETVEVDFGDGDKRTFFEVGFEFTKIYKRSGTYNGKYTVRTKHIDGDRTYRNEKVFEFTVKIDAFFTKWLRDNVNPKFYNTQGWYDVSEAWGTQADRLYNEIQGLMESLDIENIDDRFLLSLANTYGDFIKIYERVGFTAFVNEKEDPFKYLKDYRIFERLEIGDMTQEEKRELVTYIQTSRERLQLKGTPASIENAIKQFNMDATVDELWVRTFENNLGKPIKDEVLSGDLNTGITHIGVSSPIAENIDQVVKNTSNTSFIEINTAESNNIGYYTPSSETRFVDGVEYVVIPLSRPQR